MFKVRKDEPDYAFVPKADGPDENRYGQAIDLSKQHSDLTGKSLNINGDSSISENPDRYKQHGFYFNADNCISCHACESACSEKNDLAPHLAFRSVGYVEGGTYPDYHRLNISMACNHCDDPVCLKGCPTRAYTKFAEYGAVLQDPDICFGCGYCTWVCPYNAPQLDPVKGEVEKCNMCVDRLEVGLKPACVSACLASALDFGVIETTPENRDQLEVQIPGFPSPEITHPNIRFEQKKSLPREMTRPDVMPLRYERDEQGQGEYKTKVREQAEKKEWNLRKLRSREDPLVLFTLISQMVVGAFLLMFIGPMIGLEQLTPAAHSTTYSALLFGLLGIETYALFISTMHLGKPHRFYRAFNNLRYSPVSREVASLAVFYNLLGAYTLLVTFASVFTNWLGLPTELVTILTSITGWAAVVAGPVSLFFMHSIYRIKARPFWNHWQVLTSFYGNMFALGGLLVGLVYGSVLFVHGEDSSALLIITLQLMLGGLVLEALGLWRHAADMNKQGGEGAGSHYMQRSEFGKTYIARNIGMFLSIVFVAIMLLAVPTGVVSLISLIVIAILMLASAVIGRALFYVLVIPTTMPGAFFWKNKGFEEHARETGLASMPQVGVVPDSH